MEELKITDKFINDLFENETFKEKLMEYIVKIVMLMKVHMMI